MGLIKSLPPRSTKESDAKALKKSSQVQTVATTIKGGGSLLDRVASIVAIVASKLGKYENEYLLLRDEEAVRDYFDEIIKRGIGALDTETTSLDPIRCTMAGVCLYAPGLKAAYIPVNHISYITNAKSPDQVDVSVIRDCLQKCNEAGVKWIMHNGKFDTRVVYHQVGIRITCYWDTSLASRCLNENELSHGLKELHIKYCESKDDEAIKFQSLFESIPFTMVPIKSGYLYAAGDAIKTFELFLFQRKHLNRRRLPGPFNVFKYMEMPLIPVVASMEDTGIGLDLAYCEILSIKYHQELEERSNNFYQILSMYDKEIEAYKRSNPNHKLSDPVSIGSATQMAIILYDILKLTSPDKQKPRGTGEEILEQFPDVPLAQAILDYRGIAKLLSTYIDKMPLVYNQETQRVHCSFNQYGARTGRFSSSDPNMQNIPSKNKDIRKMFVAADGHVLISLDFSQQEPRTLAHMSGDEELIAAYRAGKDIYAWIAQGIYDVPYDQCLEFFPDGSKNPEGKKRRDSVKSIILGIMYGRGAKTIGEQIGKSTKEAQKIIDKFYETFPKVKVFTDETIAFAKKYGYVETAWGRKRRLPDMLLDDYEFSYITGYGNFDPLAFDQADVPNEVSMDIQRQYIARLRKTYSSKERASIKLQAKQQGIYIKDNTGLIADATRQCVNSIIQGSSADMIKKSMLLIGNDKFLLDRDCKLTLQVHDELIAHCPEEYAKECADRMAELMVRAATEKISVPMKCDAEIFRVWYGEKVA